MYEKDAMTGGRWVPWGQVWDPYHECMKPFPGTERNPSRLVQESPAQQAPQTTSQEARQ